MDKTISDKLMKKIRVWQREEHDGVRIYAFLAKRAKDEANKKLLQQMSDEELTHAEVWRGYTGEDVSHNRLKVGWMKFLGVLMGFTFVLRLLEKGETLAAEDYSVAVTELPELAMIIDEERAHESHLIEMMDEERLHYVGAMVLGLNDALVELTGTIAGLTFALANTRLVALSGIITGISATLSMAASNYLAERANGNPKALKSSLYTGVAYLITVVLLVLPYLLLPNEGYITALIIMFVSVLIIIAFFNYYISVAKNEGYWKRFLEMAVISISVAAVAFGIGLLVKRFLNIDI